MAPRRTFRAPFTSKSINPWMKFKAYWAVSGQSDSCSACVTAETPPASRKMCSNCGWLVVKASIARGLGLLKRSRLLRQAQGHLKIRLQKDRQGVTVQWSEMWFCHLAAHIGDKHARYLLVYWICQDLAWWAYHFIYFSNPDTVQGMLDRCAYCNRRRKMAVQWRAMLGLQAVHAVHA
jgi:hypothetical protein